MKLYKVTILSMCLVAPIMAKWTVTHSKDEMTNKKSSYAVSSYATTTKKL